MSEQPLKAVALMGATGAGKSALAMEICEKVGSAIISCDSMQLYRGLDIGTAKPTAEERARVSHYLVDMLDLPDTCSAARWAEAAAAAIREENEAGRVPLIVGGTGMYLRALTEGFADIPPEEPAVRSRFEMLRAQHGTPYLHGLLREVDAAAAERLAENDTQRIMRALCVYESSGTPLSEWQAREAASVPEIACPVYVLEVERGQLRRRLADRFQMMMDVGWLDEVRWLLAQHLPDSHPAMRAVGYRQLIAHLRDECSLDRAIADGITATRRYAKRQATWFRHQTPDAVIGDAATLMTRLGQEFMS